MCDTLSVGNIFFILRKELKHISFKNKNDFFRSVKIMGVSILIPVSADNIRMNRLNSILDYFSQNTSLNIFKPQKVFF